MSARNFDLIVAGAGMVGASIALAAAQAGMKVALIETEMPAAGASSVAMGHLTVLDEDPVELALSRYSMALWRAWYAHREIEHSPCGTLWLATDEEEAQAARDKAIRLTQAGVRSEWLDERALREAEPALAPCVLGGLRVPDDAIVYPPGAVRIACEQFHALGGETIFARVESARDGEVKLHDGTRRAAANVVLACGLATKRLVPSLDLLARKGHLAITDRYPRLISHQLIELGYIKAAHGLVDNAVAFNLQPRPTGQLLIGSSRQQDVSTREVEPAMLARLMRRALRFVPALEQLNVIRVWTGLRPTARDGRPYIGPSVEDARTWIAAGHEGLGITTALGTARLIVDQLTGRDCAIDPKPYWPARAVA